VPSPRLTLALFVLTVCCASAQTITIRLLDAQSGKPMGHENITVDWEAPGFISSELRLDKEGLARLAVLPHAVGFSLRPGPRRGSEQNRVAYFDCNKWAGFSIRVGDVIKTGFVPRNKCGKAISSAHSGEIIFWGMPRPFLDLQ
jgi:hypothetical protein